MTSKIMLNETMQEQSVKLKISQPPRVRDLAMLTRMAIRYAADITIKKEHGSEADAKSCLALLALNARPGDTLQVIARGDDAGEAIDAFVTGIAASGEGWRMTPLAV